MYIKLNANKIVLLLATMMICFVLTACAGLSDWDYELPNGYCVRHVNTENIALIKEDGRYVIKRYVLEFCYSDSYIGIKRLPISDQTPYEEVLHIEEMDTSNPDYYLVDTVNDSVMGPYTADKYVQQIQALKIEDMCDWIKTVPKPEGAE